MGERYAWVGTRDNSLLYLNLLPMAQDPPFPTQCGKRGVDSRVGVYDNWKWTDSPSLHAKIRKNTAAWWLVLELCK